MPPARSTSTTISYFNWTSLGFTADGTDIVGSDPLLVAPTAAGDDYTLAAGSPALGVGTGGDDMGLLLIGPPDTVFVDDDYADNTPGDMVNFPDDGGVGPFEVGFDAFATLQDGIAGVGNSTINVAPGTYVESGQIVIASDVNIIGDASSNPVIMTDQDTASSGDARGWWLVDSGVTLVMENLVLNGTGFKVWQGIRSHGTLTVTDCSFTEIKFDASGPSYAGTAITTFDASGLLTVSDCTFTEIGRIGIHVFGPSLIERCTYTGKGTGDFLDYMTCVGSFGASVGSATITDCTVTGNLGVASSDGSTSAGMLVTTFFGAGSEATITGCRLNGNTVGLVAGFDNADTSTLIANNNDLSGNDDFGVINTSATTTVDASANWWGTNTPASVAAEISGTVDYTPWLDAGTDTSGDPGFQGDFSTLNVDDDSPQTGPDGRIQEGVDLVTASTVNVLPGTYTAQVVIDKSLTLLGAGAGVSIIEAPDPLTADGDGFFHIVTISGAGVDVELTGFTITGPGPGGCATIHSGIFVRDDANGNIHDNTIADVRDDPFSGCQNGIGILIGRDFVGTDGTATLTDNTLVGYQKGGIVVDGAGSSADIVGNSVTGIGNTVVTAQNGIQISRGASATIEGNTVSDHLFTVGTFASTGLLFFEASSVDVTNNNQITDNFPGAFFQDSSGTFDGNTISNPTADPGDGFYAFNTAAGLNGGGKPRVPVAPFDGEGSSRGAKGRSTSGAMSVTVTNSEFIGHDLADSWGVTAFSAGPVSVLTVSNSVIRDWDNGLVAFNSGGPVDLTADGNAIFSNTSANFFSDVADLQNASGNWWGTSDPVAVAGLIDGLIDYTPWLDVGTDTSADPGFQGDFSTLHVDDDSAQVGAQDRISEGIDLVTGSTVIVAAGTYNTRLTITKSVDLLGAQAGVDPTPSGARTTPAAESIITESGLSTPNPDVLIEIPSGVTNVLIDGFTLEGDLTNPVADTSVIRCWDDDITIDNNIIDGRVGVLYKGADNLDVLSNRFTVNKNGYVGVQGTTTNLTVSGNTFSVGASLESDPSAIQMSAVTGGVFSGNTATGFTGGRGLGGSNLHTLDISGNSFTNGKDSISIFGGSTFIDITGNVLSGNTRHGINIKGADLVISTNRIMGNADSGISIDRHVIDTERVSVNFNTITGNSNFGVKVNTANVPEVIDAENNFWGDTSGPEDLLGTDEAGNPPCFDPATMKNSDGTGNAVTDLGVDYCPWLLGEGSMTLEVPAGCQSDTQISVEVWMRDLAKNANGFQAFLTYDNVVLSYNGAASSYTNDPFPLHIQPIGSAEVSPGQLNLDGSDSFGGDGTNADSLLATLVFDVNVVCGPTSVDFDTGGAFPSELSFDGTPLPTSLADTPALTLDSTDPVITCPGPVTVECDEPVGPSTTFGATGATTGGISVYYNTTGPADLSNAAYIRTHVSITNSNGAEYFFDTTPLTGVPVVSWESIFSGIAPLTQFGLDMIRPLPTDDGSVVIPTLTGVDNTDGTPGGATPAGTVSWAFNDYKPNAPNGPTNATNAPANSIIRGPVGGNPMIDIEIVELELVGATLTFSAKLDSDDIIHWFTPATPDSPVSNFGLNGDFYISGTLTLAASAGGVDHFQGTMTVVANAPTASGVATATDNCTVFPAITVSDDASGLTGCNGTGDIIRTWTATDDCGLSVSCDQIVTVEDSTAPVIDPEASALTVECDGAGNAAEFAAWLASNGGAAATDNCGSVTFSNNSTGLSDLCGETGAETVTFTATDDCGNFSTTTATFTIEDTVAPAIDTSPASFDINADAGGCTAVVTYTAPGATDDCDAAPVVTCVPASGTVFAEGTTTVTCTAVDDCGNSDAGSVWSFDVLVNSVNDVNIDIQLAGVSIATTRCIHFVTDDCGVTADVELAFDATGLFSGIVEIPCGSWTQLCVKDEQHTLYDTAALTDNGTTFSATPVSLSGGDTDNDSDVDINDVTLFLAQFGDLASDGGCEWDGTRDADFSNNGAVGSEDYTFLTTNWLTFSSCSCTISANGPEDDGESLATSVSVFELPTEVVKKADLNGDGVVDYKDVRLFEVRNGLPHELSTLIEASMSPGG